MPIVAYCEQSAHKQRREAADAFFGYLGIDEQYRAAGPRGDGGG